MLLLNESAHEQNRFDLRKLLGEVNETRVKKKKKTSGVDFSQYIHWFCRNQSSRPGRP